MAEFEVERVGGELKRFGVEALRCRLRSCLHTSPLVPSLRPLSRLCRA